MVKIAGVDIFSKKKVLIIGGSGFVGQNFVSKLLSVNSQVTVFDKKNSYPQKKLKFVPGDVRDSKALRKTVKNKDYIINLAALRPIESMSNPILDLEITCLGALNIFEACRILNKKCKVIFFGSGLEYGSVSTLPVSENNNNFDPDTFYGVHKLSVLHYCRIYSKLHKVDSTILRFSNIYGPEINTSDKMSIVNLFIKLAMLGKDLPIFGKGNQIGDYLYIDDALEAVAGAALSKKSSGQVFNIGSGKPTSLINMAKTVTRIVGKGRVKKVKWPQYYNIMPRDYCSDFNKAKKLLGWEPRINLETGIKLTMEELAKYNVKNK